MTHIDVGLKNENNAQWIIDVIQDNQNDALLKGNGSKRWPFTFPPYVRLNHS